MVQFSDNLKSAISELSQDITAEIAQESRNDKRTIAEVTIDMLDVCYPEASDELKRLIASSSLEEVIAQAMECVPTS